MLVGVLCVFFKLKSVGSKMWIVNVSFDLIILHCNDYSQFKLYNCFFTFSNWNVIAIEHYVILGVQKNGLEFV